MFLCRKERGQGRCCFSLLLIALLNTTTESDEAGQKGFFWLTVPQLGSQKAGTQGRNARQEPGGRSLRGDVEEHSLLAVLLACSPMLAQPAFLSQDHWPRDGPSPSGRGPPPLPPPMSIINQEHVLQICLQTILGGISSAGVSSSQMTLYEEALL